MARPHQHRRAVLALGILLACCPSLLALDPSLDISQYAHSAWKVREGFSKGIINAIAQTPDGYLWIGTEFGLFRFDGVRSIPWQAPAGEPLPSNLIESLVAGRDGTLWIGTYKGLASWKDGKLTPYPELAGQSIFALLEDREGTVWAGEYGRPTGRLCAIRGGKAECYGRDGTLGMGVDSLYEDSRGNLWAGGHAGVWRWKPGPPKFYAAPDPEADIHALMEGDQGELLLTLRVGIAQLVDGKAEAYPLPATVHPFKP